MSSDHLFDPMPDAKFMLGHENPGDLKARVQRQHDAYHAERRASIAAQASPFSPPEDRIALWESLHSVRLPLDPAHKLLSVIAMQTELTLEQVREEQRRRAALKSR